MCWSLRPKSSRKRKAALFNLSDVIAWRSTRCEVADATRKDPRIVELILRESSAISRSAPGVLITRNRLGFVSASSGIDQSNVDGGEETGAAAAARS